MSFRILGAISSAASLLVLALVTAGCGERNTYVKPPPPEVEVVNPIVGPVDVPREAPGRTRAYALAEIRARVQGFLQPIDDFRPGSFVKKDQILFRIEREEFEAAVKAAVGEREAAEASARIAKSNYDKRQAASASGAVSKIDVESALAEFQAAEAAVTIAKAKEEDAQRALNYTELKSPIDGRVSQTLVDVGNLVGAGEPTLLTTVVQDDPIFVDFEANEREIIKHLSKRPGVDQADYDKEFKAMKVRLFLSDGSEYPITGNLDFLDNQVDGGTGTIKARAVFKNPDGALVSGMFVRISLDDNVPNAIQVPAIAIQRDLGGAYVVVVGEDNAAERRPVEETRHVLGDMVVLNSGVSAEDRVIVTNLQRARPGTTVVVVEAGAKPEKTTDAADGEGEAGGDEKPAPEAPEEPAAKAEAEAAAKP